MKAYLASITIITIIVNGTATSFSAYKNFYETIVKQDGLSTSYLVNILWNHNVLDVSSNQNRCYHDINEFKKGVYSGEEWALRMLDSSAHIQSGFLTGNIINYGNFEECININDTKTNVRGKFCTSQIRIYHTEIGYRNQKYSEIFHTMTMSLCAPHSCRTKQIDEMVKRHMNKTKLYEFESFDCLTKKETDLKLTRSQLLIIIFFVAISILLLFGTTYDVLIKGSVIYNKIFKGKVFGIPLAFSILSNGQNLLTENDNRKSINCIYGLRFISACGILIVHRNLREIQPYTNVFTVDEKLTKWYRMFIMNAYLFVDVFFLLSGLLISYTFLKKRTEGLHPLSLLLHRYIRLTPPLAVTIMLTQLIHLMCTGFNCWHYSVINEKENCENNWFFTVLYITNLVGVSKKCLPHSWYLTADMQLFIFSFMLLYILAKSENPKYIFYILTFLLMLSMSTVFIVSYIFMIPSIPITSSDTNFKEAEYIYEPFYTRAGPWLIGFGLGILIYEFDDNPFKMNKIFSMLGWIISIICILTASFGIYPFFQQHFVHDQIVEYVYKAVYRNLWALGFAWIIYTCYTGHGGIVNTFLSWHTFQPLSKLSYCLYLIHPFIQTIQMGDKTYPREFSDMSQISTYIGDIFYSILTALILHLAIEAPSLGLEKLFRSTKDNSHELQRFNSNQTETESIE